MKEKGVIDLPYIPKECGCNAHMFYIKAKDIDERIRLIGHLNKNNINAVFYYIPLHSAPASKGYGVFAGEDKYTTRKSERLLRLPMYFGLKGEEIEYICEKKIFTSDMKLEKTINLKNEILDNWEKIYTVLMLCGVVLTIVLMYVRCFYGTELSDEAYYVSEAKEILNGNIPYAYNNSSIGVGFTFLLIPIVFVHSLFSPALEGVFLATRLCFVTLKVIVSLLLYYIFRKNIKDYNALLLVGVMIPLSGYFQNFNYNNVPIWLLLLSGTLLYDVIEQDSKHKKIELICAGFVATIGVFANPGWGLTLVIFALLILIRCNDKELKIQALLCFFGAALAEVLIVVVSISIQTSVGEAWYGFYRLFINPIPVDSLAPDKSLKSSIASFIAPVKLLLMISLPIGIFTYILSKRYIREKENRLENKHYAALGILIAMVAYFGACGVRLLGSDCIVTWWAFATCVYIFLFIFTGTFKQEKIIFYLGIYPIVFAIAEIILVDYNASVNRFSNAFTIIIPLLYVLLKQKSEIIRIVATALAGMIILFMGYTDFKYVYRDDTIGNLDYKVESGVYKGIYTTEVRSTDLVDLEEYLNNLIGEGDTYSFRDNVPFAYLMVHQGKVCELSTWDYLQYSYHRNSPAPLFDYYRRRGMIPDWIIYIDYGRDENVSIEDSEFRYNDWVNAYYDKLDDFVMNETFYHVIVYKYNGTFDGDYQTWIDSYWNLLDRGGTE